MSALDFDRIEASIARWVLSMVGYQSAWAHQNKPRPPRPYVELQTVVGPHATGAFHGEGLREIITAARIRIDAVAEDQRANITVNRLNYGHDPGAAETIEQVRDAVLVDLATADAAERFAAAAFSTDQIDLTPGTIADDFPGYTEIAGLTALGVFPEEETNPEAGTRLTIVSTSRQTVLETIGDNEFTVQVTVDSTISTGRKSAQAAAYALLHSLDRPGVRASLRAAGLVSRRVSTPRDVSRTIDDEREESRHQFDVVFAAIARAPESCDFIESVEIHAPGYTPNTPITIP